MNVHLVCTTAICMHPAMILRGVITAPVMMVSWEMVSIAQVSVILYMHQRLHHNSCLPYCYSPDIDECFNTTLCHELAYCVNTNGSYTCNCSDGYDGDGVEDCSGMQVIMQQITFMPPLICRNL